MGLFKGAKRLWGDITGKSAAKTAEKAGRRQAQAIREGLQMQQRQIPLALEDLVRGAGEAGRELLPFRQMGRRALQQYEALPGEIEGADLPEYEAAEFRAPTAEEVSRDPAVRFRMQEAERALTARQAARGSALGGGAQRELARYMQGLASQEYGQAYGRRFQEAQFAEEQARFAPQFQEQQRQFNLAQRMQALAGLTSMGFGASGEVAGVRERLGQMMSSIRTGSGAAAASAIQAAGQARASGALAGAAARQQAMGNLMRLGGTLGAAYMTGGTSLAAQGAMGAGG